MWGVGQSPGPPIKTPTTRAGAATAYAAGAARDLGARLVALEVVDRALVIGAQAFSALIPVLLVLSSVGPHGGRSFADDVITRFQLTGRGAEAVHEILTLPEGGYGVRVLGVTLLIISALSFTRALQRTYELAWGLSRRGVRGSGWGLAWLVVFAVYWLAATWIDGRIGGRSGLLAAVGLSFALWLVTPYMLLARRLPAQRLVPQALLTAGGMSALAAGAVIYVPTAMSKAAKDFGAIGCAFTMLSFLWAVGGVIVVAAAVGAFIVRRAGREA